MSQPGSAWEGSGADKLILLDGCPFFPRIEAAEPIVVPPSTRFRRRPGSADQGLLATF